MSHVFQYQGSYSGPENTTSKASQDSRAPGHTPRNTFAPSARGTSNTRNESGKRNMTFNEARWGYENGWSPLSSDAARRRGYMNFSNVRKDPHAPPRAQNLQPAYATRGFSNTAVRRGLYDTAAAEPFGCSKSILAEKLKHEREHHTQYRPVQNYSGTSTIRQGLAEFSECTSSNLHFNSNESNRTEF